MGEFLYEGHRIEYEAYGEGDRAVILVHGLLMNRRMYRSSARRWPSTGTGRSASTCSATAAPTAPRTFASTRCRSSPASSRR